MKSQWLFSLMITILFCACTEEHVTDQNENPKTNNIQVSSNAEMAAILKAFHESMPPNESIYLNVARSKMARKAAIGKPPGELVQNMLVSTYEGILGGMIQSSLLDLDSLSQFVEQYDFQNKEEIQNKITELQATGYLRLGEVINCLYNHSSTSCIVPFSEAAVHTDRSGSQRAINVLLAKLAKDPGDDISKWMLNIAYMTLGEYPKGVPSEYLIPILQKETNGLFPPMSNVSAQAKLDDNRLSGGVIAQDFNNDGWLDLFVTSWSNDHQVYLYINKGDGSFSNDFEAWGLKGITGGLNITSTDYNNDGFIDVFIPRGGWLKKGPPNSLLRNNGDGSFTDVTKELGLFSEFPTQTAIWADFNNDGWADVAIGNESSNVSHPCELYLNQEGRQFINVAKDVNFDIIGYVKGLASTDIDNDGDQDIFVSDMRGENYLMVNGKADNAHGFSFTNEAKKAGVSLPKESFPCWFFDFNNDGWQDLFVSGYSTSLFNQLAGEYAKFMSKENYAAEGIKLYQNQGDGTFMDVTTQVGLHGLAFTMGSNFGDINNDGYLDFYLATGEPDLRTIVPNRLFLNNKGKSFEEVTSQSATGHLQKGHAVAFVDLDNDGDQDIYCVLGGAYEGDNFFNALFKNNWNKGNWLKVQLEGVKTNRAGLGAKLEVHLEGGQTLYRTVDNSSSFGENPFMVHLGLGEKERLEKLVIHWPSGIQTEYFGISKNQRILVREGENKIVPLEVESFDFSEKEPTHHHHHNH